jgi:hypothetical protein
LRKTDLIDFSARKSELWEARLHETSTRAIPEASGDYFRGMRLTPGDIERFAQKGMGDLKDQRHPRIDATNKPSDAWIFALTGGHNPHRNELRGPKEDYLAVIFRIGNVGRELPFVWNTHGPAYSSDRLWVTRAIKPDQITGMWVYDKKSETFVDHSATWDSLRSNAEQSD